MASVITTIIDGLAWLWALISLIFGTIFTFLRIFVETLFNQLIFGYPGRILLASLILIGFGFTMTVTHHEVFEQFDEFYCDIVETRQLFAEILDTLADTFEIFICFYNLMASIASQMLAVFFDIVVDCGDRIYLAIFEAIGLILLRSTEATLGFLTNPLNNSFPFFSPRGAEEAAAIPFITPDQDDVWHPIVDAIDITRELTACLCEDSFVNDVYNFLLDRITSPFIGCAIDRGINSLLNGTQVTLNTILDLTQPNFEPPDYKFAFTVLCQMVICLGDYIDEWIFEVLDLFLSPGLDLQIGCTLARAICFLIEWVSFVIDTVIRGIVTGDLINVLDTADLSQILMRGYELADCVEEAFGLIDVCVGQFFGGIVRMLPVILQFLIQLLQQQEFAIEPVLNNITQLLGDTRFDHPGDSHLGLQGQCFPTCDHTTLPGRPFTQTGLTCIISKMLGNGACAMAAADVVNSFVQLFFWPFLVVDELLVTDFTVLNFDGNPLAGDNRDDFDDLILDIVCILTDRFLLIFDYIGHLIQCINGLEGLGNAIVQLTEAINFVIDEIKSLLLLAVEVILQAVIWIFTLFGADPFGGGTTGELLTFFELFFDLFIELFDIILEIVKGLVDFVLFPWFPGIFGQGTLLSGNPGTARFTFCFEEFGDCVCGISKALADEICLPFGIGCLSALWPDCNEFEPLRRRQLFLNESMPMYDSEGKLIYNGTVFQYWADQFGDTVCGDVFERWRDGVDPETSIGDSDGMEFLNCISMMHSSVKTGDNISDVDGDFFVNLNKLNATAHHVAKGFGAMATTETLNLMLYYSDPADVLGRPEGNPAYLLLNETLALYGINDTVAVNTVLGIRDSLSGIASGLWDALNHSEITDSQPFAKQTVGLISKSGTIINRAISVSVMTLQEMRATGVFRKTKDGIVEATSAAIDTAQYNTRIRRSVMEAEVEEAKRQNQRRQDTDPTINGDIPLHQPFTQSNLGVEFTARSVETLRLLQQNKFPYPITTNSYRYFRMRRFFRALWEYGNHIVGAETISPKYDARAEAILEDHKDFSCTSVFVGCPEDIGIDGTNNHSALNVPPCLALELFANFRVCNDLFDAGQHAVVTNCVENFQALDFYDSLQACEDIDDNPIEPDFSIRVAFNITKCMETTGLGWLCLNGLGCTACPVDQVIPGFECSFLDGVVHRFEFLARRCIDKFGLGPALPEIPTNVTEWFFDFLEIRNQTLVRTGLCGNFRIDNASYCVLNPITRQEFCFDGETCDPPDWDIINGVIPSEPGQQICGSACQNVSCGNGIPETPGEECDDGNNNNGDGCDAYCRLEVCGNGRLNFGGICTGSASSGFQGENCNLFGVPIWLEWQEEVLNPEFPIIYAECGICRQGNASDPLDGEPCIWRETNNNVLSTEPAGCICVQEGICIPTNISSPIFGQVCFDGVNGDFPFNTCPFDGFEVPNCSTPGTNLQCGDERLNCGLDPTLRCVRKEECDDGNRIPNDGCDRNCQLEQCPKIFYNALWTAETDSPVQDDPNLDNRFCDDTQGTALDGPLPETCFALPPLDPNNPQLVSTHGVELNCKAGDPVVWSYDNPICDGNRRVFETQIIRNCSINNENITGQGVICVDTIFDPEITACTNAVQVGLEFTCTENCVVCGDNITNATAGEQCDDGTVLVTGIPGEDDCVLCQLSCDCHPNPLAPCSGFCVGGLLSGQTCDPRSDEPQCDNAPCVAFECCGDGNITGAEVIPPRCDRTPDPSDPAKADGETCIFCVSSDLFLIHDFCVCQAGKPCEGLCWEHLEGEITSAPVFTFPPGDHIPCDMRLEPFACPTEGQFCLPYSCCGDGIIQPQGPIPFFLGAGNLQGECDDPAVCNNRYCEPGVSVDCNTTGIEEHCGYNRGGDNDTFAEFFNTEAGLEEGRKDQCECQPGKPCLGKCYTQYGLTARTPDGDIIYCNRTGAIYTDRVGYAASTQGNSDCEAYNVTNGICGAIACCDDGIQQSPYEGLDDPDGPCEHNIDPVACNDVDCNYDDRWMWYEECECQPDKPCLGRCSFFGEFTQHLCDPRNSSATPWCPHDTDPAYRCHPKGCCNDGIIQNAHGVDAILGGGVFLSEIAMETISPFPCDDQLCGNPDSLNDCGLGANILPFVYTECECDANISIPCGGFCVIPNTGRLQPTFPAMLPIPCDPRSGDPMECTAGAICLAQQCCGDEIQQSDETCDHQSGIRAAIRNNICDIVTPFFLVEGDTDTCIVWENNSFIMNCTTVVGPANPWTVEWYNDTTCTSLVETASNVSGFPEFFVDIAGFCLAVRSCNAPCDECGLTARRRRSIIGDYENVWSAPNVRVRRQAEVVDYTIAREPVTQVSSDSPLTQFFLDLLDSILEAFGAGSTGEFIDSVTDFFTNTDTDINLPPEERGLIWYLVFPLPGFCRMPENTSCEGGIGMIRGFYVTLGYSIIILAVIQFTLGSLSGWAIWLFGLLFFSVYLGVAFFYSFPGCAISGLPRIPECLVRELADIFVNNNASCFEFWPQGLVLDPLNETCPGTCERSLVDCQDIGFQDGLDSLMFMLQTHWPEVIDVLSGETPIPAPDPASESNTFFRILKWLWKVLSGALIWIFQMIWATLADSEFFQNKVDRFDYGLDPVPEVDLWCWRVTFLNLAQIVFILAFAALIAFALLSALFLTFDRLWIFIVRGEKFVSDVTEDDEDDETIVF